MDLVDQISQLTRKTVNSVKTSNIPRRIKQGKEKNVLLREAELTTAIN
jgi:hypothetical protein